MNRTLLASSLMANVKDESDGCIRHSQIARFRSICYESFDAVPCPIAVILSHRNTVL